ncbi:type I-E CRISPR-associated protein Cas7/Cse4/CasC [Psychromonas sp. MB-3u-54]|uniref:type I-E CRISPR-associated protein Cas7/Cse4/CasC n=1 Tax=Psychromonas sp. MB-3u-54 TaxID=2058319 RepID=UPI000C31DBA0|nr:type I-E CRISPR-associated protein Cas7/Cse4/CasC [Psychromonas sp. MB-3u-54]PKH02943.1 type I-E CRISPR-associated protein Cas7/Cse4/CasC [Psychromonas sp. MB-3u-54]
MTTFINIHTLISHPSSMMNRDDSGMQKTAVFGGSVRSRISSQCLKRAIRQSDIYGEAVAEKSIRTRLYSELIDFLVENTDSEKNEIEKIIYALSIKTGTLDSGIKEEDEEVEVINDEGKKEKVKTGNKLKIFKTVQPYSAAEFKELVIIAKESFPELYESIITGLPDKAKKADKDKFKKSIVEFQGILLTVKSVIDVALSGRMDTHCHNRNLEAAMSVAHSLTTHSADIEVDWFTACDDLAEQGSGHIGTTEFSSGVFYRYASINVDLLAKNIKSTVSEVTPIINTMIRCFAQVSPSAKQKVFAAYNQADFVMATHSNQPISLANAFRKPIENNGDVMENSIAALVKNYEKLTNAYELDSKAIALDLTDSAQSKQINLVNKISDIHF